MVLEYMLGSDVSPSSKCAHFSFKSVFSVILLHKDFFETI